MFDKFPELHTERLDLVEITRSHYVDFYHIFKDERATKYYNIIPFKKEEEAQKYIDWFQSRYKDGLGIRWGIKLKDKSNIIGTVGFNNYQKNHRANLGYDLQVDYWNKGYITEALSEILNFGFDILEINRIEAEVMRGNTASERVLGKLGFTNECVLRDWMYWNNNHYDMTMFSLLKKDRYKNNLKTIALQFNECITNADLNGLYSLMTEDHVFCDTANNRIKGKDNNIIQAWEPFFNLYPGYRNIFENIVVRGSNVIMQGYSICSDGILNNVRAIWIAGIINNKVGSWCIYSDTKENREIFNL